MTKKHRLCKKSDRLLSYKTSLNKELLLNYTASLFKNVRETCILYLDLVQLVSHLELEFECSLLLSTVVLLIGSRNGHRMLFYG